MQDRVYIDIETVPVQGLSDELLEIAAQKIDKKQTKDKDSVIKFCSLNPGFGQIACIGVGTE